MREKWLLPTIIFALILTSWEMVVRLKDISPLLLPSPSLIGQAFLRELANGSLLKHTGVTLIEIFGGFLGGAFLGIGLGVMVSLAPQIYRLLQPYIIASQTMPKLALAPLFVLWLGYGYAPKIAITALISFFPLFESTLTGLLHVPRDHLALFQSLRASKWQTLWKLRVPHALPYLFSGFRVAIILSIVGAVVSEFIGANAGLGALILVSQGLLDTPLMFAVFFWLTGIGLALYHGFAWLERKFSHYN
jgi:NitT/TauT family transport system permease protein